MKILIIGNSFLPIPAVNGGAVETLVDEYLKYSIDNNNFEFTVYSPYSSRISFEDNKIYANVEFRYIRRNNLKYQFYRYIHAIKKMVNKRKKYPTSYCRVLVSDLKKRKELSKYDLVIVENEVESLIMYKKYINSKIVEHLHNDYLNIDTKCAKKIVESCDEIWCVSKFISKRVEEISHSNKSRVLYNGIDTKKFSQRISSIEKNRMLSKLNLTHDDIVVLYVGRIMPEKGVFELIKAFNRAKEKNDKLKLIIIGENKNNKKSILQYVSKLKQESEINRDSIIFYGKAFGNELVTLYSIAKIQVIPTLCNEAFGLIAVEGICAGHPLIVTNSGGLTEIVNHDSAIIVNRENIISELAEAILKISSDDVLATKLINNASKIKENFDYEKYNKRFDELIYNILKEKEETIDEKE